jgi:hypothetical protein
MLQQPQCLMFCFVNQCQCLSQLLKTLPYSIPAMFTSHGTRIGTIQHPVHAFLRLQCRFLPSEIAAAAWRESFRGGLIHSKFIINFHLSPLPTSTRCRSFPAIFIDPLQAIKDFVEPTLSSSLFLFCHLCLHPFLGVYTVLFLSSCSSQNKTHQ